MFSNVGQMDHDLDHIVSQIDQIDHDLDQMYQIHHDLDHLDQIEHDLHHLYPNLPLQDAVRDAYSTHPTQESCPRSCRLYGSRPATYARTYALGTYLP